MKKFFFILLIFYSLLSQNALPDNEASIKEIDSLRRWWFWLFWRWISNIRRKTKEKFFEEAKLVHGDEYDYSLVDYKTGHQNIIIICSVHGNFQQTASNHLTGRGCPKCGRIKATTKQTKSTEDFIKQAKVVFQMGNMITAKLNTKGVMKK